MSIDLLFSSIHNILNFVDIQKALFFTSLFCKQVILYDTIYYKYVIQYITQ